MGDLNHCGCGGTGNDSGCNSIIWIILLLCLCGGCGSNNDSCGGCGNGNGLLSSGGNGCECIIIILLLLSCCGGNSFC